ncbi:MAG: hypothetical protein M3Y87_37355 [Myxococcota bacterium]|nr:hypothetical protein [Myxococcota bacterium]
MTSRSSGWLLFLSLVAGITGAFGCGVDGERAATGDCPVGETCSDATPSGLVFDGTPVSGTLVGLSSIAPVAVGGTQRVRIRSFDRAPLPSFDAESSAANIEIADVIEDRIELRGVAPGSSLLRVLERSGGGLLDRTTVEASPIARAVVAQIGDLAMMLAPESERRRSVFVPGEHFVAVHLLDARERIVVDEGMTIDAGTPSTMVAWDAIRVVVPADGLELAVDAGGSRFTARVETAIAIDGVELATWLHDEDASGRPEVLTGGFVCGLPLAGDAWIVADETIPARYSLDGVELGSAGEGVPRCAEIPDGTPEGSAELTIEIGGASRTFAISIRRSSSTSASLGGPIELRARSRALGDRASAVLSH